MAKTLKLVTHDGSFHTDDIFSAAALSMYLDNLGANFGIIRTRKQEILDDADYVFDVGGVYDEETNRFDHHQIGGAGRHDNDIEYSSFGLIWKKFGAKICEDQKAADIIDKKLVIPIDAWDNGFDLVTNKYDASPYFIQHLFFSMQPTWREEDLTADEMFFKSVEIAKTILSREIIQAKDAILAEKSVMDIYNNTEDKRIIVLDKYYPFQYILHNFKEPLFAIYPRRSDGRFGVKAIKEDQRTFNNRKNFPASWAGLRDEEFQKATGVKDAVFCHRALFMAVAESKEGAVKLAQIAVES